MKKQFFRVKQLADQTFSRAGKTEVLSDDLQEADRHVEFLRNACTNTNKKLAACLLGMGNDDAAREKRLKKCPEYLLGHAMQESSTCDENFLLRHVLARCGSVEVALANELVELDMRTEASVVNPLQAVLDTEVPSILKHKRNLARLTLDMDSARTRYQQASKHTQSNVAGVAKVEAIREEMEDAESKVEQCRDALASEMFQLISKETDLARLVAHYVNLQKSYHERALQFLEKMIPDLETYINDSDTKPVFGFPLEEHLRVTGRKIAFPIELCVCALLELGMEEEGLFRVAGGASKVRRMKMSLDAQCLSLQTCLDYSDAHVVAGVLKSYLRELPEPLLTHKLYGDWMAAAKLQSSNEARLKALNDVLQRLPAPNRDNLRYLVKFLSALSRNQDVNKMTPQNIAIVIAPNLIWNPVDDSAVMGMNMSTANIHSFIVDNLVTFADYFFPQDVEFYLTFARSEPVDVSTPLPTRNSLINGMAGERGHARSSSGDTMLISTDSDNIKRTQSNSSLTEHSPPHSPKLVPRRKNKVAPHPPSATSKQEGPDRPEKPPRPVTVCVTPGRSVSSQKLEPMQAREKVEPFRQKVEASREKAESPREKIETVQAREKTEPVRQKIQASWEKTVQPAQKIESLPTREKVEPSKIKVEALWEKPESAREKIELFQAREKMQNIEASWEKTKQAAEKNDPLQPCEKVEPLVQIAEAIKDPSREKTESIVKEKVEPIRPKNDPPRERSDSLPSPVRERNEASFPEPRPKPSTAERSSADLGQAESDLRPKVPVAAPRTILIKTSSQEQLEEKPGDERAKPAIPERPASLRQGSFRAGRAEETADKSTETSSRGLMLDKPQVSIVQVGGERTAAEEGARPAQEVKRNSMEKPERPPKPELAPIMVEKSKPEPTERPAAGERSSQASASESTDEDIADSEKTGSSRQVQPSSPRGHPSRPPRPQPPPPPPPVKRAPGGAPLSESTDL